MTPAGEALSRLSIRYYTLQVYGNIIDKCLSYGVKVMISPQEKICDNIIKLPPGVEEEDVSVIRPADYVTHEGDGVPVSL